MSDDVGVALSAAEAAAETLLRIRSRHLGRVDSKEVGQLGDRESNRVIQEVLRRAFPRDHILSEESADEPSRVSARRVWIVDPLDGTREFGEPGREDWAVHIALVEEGSLTAGVVALPAAGELHSTSAAEHCEAHRHDGPMRVVVSRTRPPQEATELERRLSVKLVPMGSAGAKAMAVVRGEADAYVHSGGQWEWDSAAPVAVCRAAGLHVSRLGGDALCFNQPSPWLPDLLVCRPELRDTLLESVAACSN
jgi:3'(2'), 5'-bisphosphate nucleotidase